MLSEELILHFAWKLYSKYTIREKAIIRVTRHADIDESGVYDEDLDYRDVMEHLIKKRNKLSSVRVELRARFDEGNNIEVSKRLEPVTIMKKMPISELRLIH